MMDEDLFIGFFGLILTQLRYARRALEDVERSTARYAGGNFAAALQAGPRFGAPPILDGALKVHIVNINDLSGGQNGLGSLFGNLVSGLGGMIGGIGGGFIGGLIGGAALPYNLAQLRKIVEALGSIMPFIDKGKDKDKDKEKKEPPTDYPALTGLLRALTQMLPPLTNLVNALGTNLPRLVAPITALFHLFTDKPEKADAATPAAHATPAPPTDWVRFVEALTPVVKGATLLVPILVGAFASLVVHLGDVQRAITDLLSWALRLLFLLRGAALVVLYDTLAAVARVAAQTLTILATAVLEIMSAVFTAIERGLALAMDMLAVLSKGISDTLNAIVSWMRTTLIETLTMLGNLPVFATIINAVNAVSGLMGMVTGTKLPPVAMPTPAAGTGVSVAPATSGLDLSNTLLPPEKLAKLGVEYGEAASSTFKDIKHAADKLTGALGEIEKRNRALEAGVGKSAEGSPLDKALKNVEAGIQGPRRRACEGQCARSRGGTIERTGDDCPRLRELARRWRHERPARTDHDLFPCHADCGPGCRKIRSRPDCR